MQSIFECSSGHDSIPPVCGGSYIVQQTPITTVCHTFPNGREFLSLTNASHKQRLNILHPILVPRDSGGLVQHSSSRTYTLNDRSVGVRNLWCGEGMSSLRRIQHPSQ